MKRQIRRGVFETNSSSCHSVSFEPETNEESQYDMDLEINDEDLVEVKLGEFGWGYDEYTDSKTKLSYITTMAKCGFNEKSDIEKINTVVADVMDCDGILILEPKNSWGDAWYIDHQSVYDNIDDFLDMKAGGASLDEFIFNPKYKLIIDNDNH